MRKPVFLILAAILLAGVAFAGFVPTYPSHSTVLVTDGTAPDMVDAGIDAGVPLANVQYCRVAAMVRDGGNVNTCDMRYWYNDPNNLNVSAAGTYGWAPSSAPDCLCKQNLLTDGGAPAYQFCDLAISAEVGKLGVQWVSGLMQDAGPVSPEIVITCWGPALPTGRFGGH